MNLCVRADVQTNANPTAMNTMPKIYEKMNAMCVNDHINAT